MKAFISTVITTILIGFLFTACQPKQPEQKAERKVPVEVTIVKPGDLEESLTLTGVLKAIHSVDVVSEVSGKIVQINKNVGDRVTPADILARIDDKVAASNYKQAQAQLLSAENNLKIANLNMKSDEELLKSGDISDLAYENTVLAVKSAEAQKLSAEATLSTLEKAYLDTRIKTPVKGQISRKFIELGSMVTPGTPLFHVVDLSVLKLEVGAPQDLISRIHQGMAAEIEVSSLQNAIFAGTVRHISPQAEANSGSFSVEIHIPNQGESRLLAGMTARAHLRINNSGEHLSLPDVAIVLRDDKPHIYKVEGSIAKLTPVSIMQKIGTHSIIEDGIAAGDTVVTVGVQNLGIDTRVWIEQVH